MSPATAQAPGRDRKLPAMTLDTQSGAFRKQPSFQAAPPPCQHDGAGKLVLAELSGNAARISFMLVSQTGAMQQDTTCSFETDQGIHGGVR